ncbi:MAG: molybdate ABC transporter substrate-binding protein [Betaproteobacteria bacterium]
MIRHFLFALSLMIGLASALPSNATTLTVSAAASLRDAFTEIGAEFEKANPPHRVQFNFGGSGQLLQQLKRGAPVDVFASADIATMDGAEAANLIFRDGRANFARNQMVLVIPPDSRLAPRTMDDLREPGYARIAIGNPESVPAGHYAMMAMVDAGLWDALKPKTVNTQNVRQTLDYVARGEADAGFVYLTDALTMRDRVKVAFNVPHKAQILYPIAALKGWGNERLARKFVEFVTGEPGQRILAKYQFARP